MYNLYKVLLLTSLTLSLDLRGQVTKKCYTYTELQNIARTALKCRELDTLLKVSNAQLSIKDSVAKEYNVQVATLLSVIDKEEEKYSINVNMLKLKDREILQLTRRNKWLKFGWITTTAAISTALLLLILTR